LNFYNSIFVNSWYPDAYICVLLVRDRMSTLLITTHTRMKALCPRPFGRWILDFELNEIHAAGYLHIKSSLCHRNNKSFYQPHSPILSYHFLSYLAAFFAKPRNIPSVHVPVPSAPGIQQIESCNCWYEQRIEDDESDGRKLYPQVHYRLRNDESGPSCAARKSMSLSKNKLVFPPLACPLDIN